MNPRKFPHKEPGIKDIPPIEDDTDGGDERSSTTMDGAHASLKDSVHSAPPDIENVLVADVHTNQANRKCIS